MNAQQQLDSEELLHLAIRATEADRNDEAISLLKQAMAQEPENGKVRYLLGAVHAQIGMYDRAVEEISQAVALEPELHPAHFQLGLLHITSGRLPEAEQAWAPLEALGVEHPFTLFKSGMLHLAHDEFEACIQDLERGIQLNDINAPLNEDMRKIIDAARMALQKESGRGAGGAQPGETQGGRHILLSAYQKDEDSH